MQKFGVLNVKPAIECRVIGSTPSTLMLRSTVVRVQLYPYIRVVRRPLAYSVQTKPVQRL